MVPSVKGAVQLSVVQWYCSTRLKSGLLFKLWNFLCSYWKVNFQTKLLIQSITDSGHNIILHDILNLIGKTITCTYP